MKFIDFDAKLDNYHFDKIKQLIIDNFCSFVEQRIDLKFSHNTYIGTLNSFVKDELKNVLPLVRISWKNENI